MGAACCPETVGTGAAGPEGSLSLDGTVEPSREAERGRLLLPSRLDFVRADAKGNARNLLLSLANNVMSNLERRLSQTCVVSLQEAI
jgi:hypothetical protein